MSDETEPPIREFADRGVIWLLENPQNLHDLVALLSDEIAAHLDFSRLTAGTLTDLDLGW